MLSRNFFFILGACLDMKIFDESINSCCMAILHSPIYAFRYVNFIWEILYYILVVLVKMLHIRIVEFQLYITVPFAL